MRARRICGSAPAEGSSSGLACQPKEMAAWGTIAAEGSAQGSATIAEQIGVSLPPGATATNCHVRGAAEIRVLERMWRDGPKGGCPERRNGSNLQKYTQRTRGNLG